MVMRYFVYKVQQKKEVSRKKERVTFSVGNLLPSHSLIPKFPVLTCVIIRFLSFLSGLLCYCDFFVVPFLPSFLHLNKEHEGKHGRKKGCERCDTLIQKRDMKLSLTNPKRREGTITME